MCLCCLKLWITFDGRAFENSEGSTEKSFGCFLTPGMNMQLGEANEATKYFFIYYFFIIFFGVKKRIVNVSNIGGVTKIHFGCLEQF